MARSLKSIKDRYRREPLLFLVTFLAIIGVVVLLGGVMYSTLTAAQLPSFIPGHVAGVNRKRSARGHFGLVLGVVVLLITGVIATDVRKRP